jgi:hypothetical protein
VLYCTACLPLSLRYPAGPGRTAFGHSKAREPVVR